MMMRNVSQSLAGRAGLCDLLPMSYTESKEANTNLSLDELLFRGFYPAAVTGKSEPEMLYPAYVRTYLDRDVNQLLHIKDMMQFNTFLRLCAARIGSVFVASQLAAEVGVSVPTVQSWLSILQASYVVYLLPPYYNNPRKRLTRSPKLYFCDTGFACHLLNIESPRMLKRDKMRGALFENFVVMEALKHRFNQGQASNLFYFRDATGNEIDLLLFTGGEVVAVEIKSSTTYNASFERVLRRADQYLVEPISRRAVLYAGEYENQGGEIELCNYRHLAHLWE